MVTISRLAALVAVFCIATASAFAHGTKSGTIEIGHAWTVETSAGEVARVAMPIKNTGLQGDVLIGASTAMANTVTLEAGLQGPTIDAIAIAGKGREILTFNGRHLRLTGITKPLSLYDTFPLTLIFKRAGKIVIEVQVEETPASATPGSEKLR